MNIVKVTKLYPYDDVETCKAVNYKVIALNDTQLYKKGDIFDTILEYEKPFNLITITSNRYTNRMNVDKSNFKKLEDYRNDILSNILNTKE